MLGGLAIARPPSCSKNSTKKISAIPAFGIALIFWCWKAVKTMLARGSSRRIAWRELVTIYFGVRYSTFKTPNIERLARAS